MHDQSGLVIIWFWSSSSHYWTSWDLSMTLQTLLLPYPGCRSCKIRLIKSLLILDLWLRMENESRNSEEQSRKLIRIKNQWFVSTESESDSDDSVMIRIRIDTCNTYSTIETWPDSWHSVSDHGHLSPAVRTSGSRNLVGLQWHSLYQHVIWWRRSLSCYLARLWRLCWRTPGVFVF